MALQHQSTVFTPSTHHLLPNEIMTLIFSSVTDSQSTLYQCTLINKSFYGLANSMLWHSPQLGNKSMATRFFKGMHDLSKQRCDTLGQLIHDLHLSYENSLDDYIRSLLQVKPIARHIRLFEGQDYQVLLDRLHMPNLQHLTLSNCIGDNLIRHLLPHARLISLKLHKAFVTTNGFDTLALCPLEDFEWSMNLGASSDILQHLKPCPLRRLAIHYIPARCFTSNPPIQTPFARLMMDPLSFPLLTVLELNGCPHINDQVLTAFFNHHPLLEQLHLSYQYITDATLDAMELPHLKRASLTHLEDITTAAIHRLITTCPLSYLDVSHCDKIDIESLPAFVVKKGACTLVPMDG